MNAIAIPQYTFGDQSFVGSALTRRVFVSSTRRREVNPCSDAPWFEDPEDHLLVLAAELLAAQSKPSDFESWEKVKASMGL